MKGNIDISVIVPIYNTKDEYLRECIASILDQSYKSFELILIDDGSYTGNIDSICTDACKKDDRVKYHKKDNGGVSSARNLGIILSKGDYIIFLDSDDTLKEHSLEIISNFTLTGKYDIVMFNHYKSYTDYDREVYALKKSGEILNNFEEVFDMKILGYSTQKAYRREMITRFEFNSSLSYAEDLEFNFRVFPNIKSAYYIHDVLYRYRIYSSSTVRNVTKYSLQSVIDSYIKTIDTINENLKNNSSDEILNAFNNANAILLLVILTNIIYSKSTEIKYRNRVALTNKLIMYKHFKTVFGDIRGLRVSLSKKISLYFIKFRMYSLFLLATRIKEGSEK